MSDWVQGCVWETFPFLPQSSSCCAFWNVERWMVLVVKVFWWISECSSAYTSVQINFLAIPLILIQTNASIAQTKTSKYVNNFLIFNFNQELSFFLFFRLTRSSQFKSSEWMCMRERIEFVYSIDWIFPFTASAGSDNKFLLSLLREVEAENPLQLNWILTVAFVCDEFVMEGDGNLSI